MHLIWALSLSHKLTKPIEEAEPQPTRPFDTQQGAVVSIAVQDLVAEQTQVWRKLWKAGEERKVISDNLFEGALLPSKGKSRRF